VGIKSTAAIKEQSPSYCFEDMQDATSYGELGIFLLGDQNSFPLRWRIHPLRMKLVLIRITLLSPF